jgi:hypothetical protein
MLHITGFIQDFKSFPPKKNKKSSKIILLKSIYARLVKGEPLKKDELILYKKIIESSPKKKDLKDILSKSNKDNEINKFETLIRSLDIKPLNYSDNKRGHFFKNLLKSLLTTQFYFSRKQIRKLNNINRNKEQISGNNKQFLLSLTRCLPRQLKYWIEAKTGLKFEDFKDLIARIRDKVYKSIKDIKINSKKIKKEKTQLKFKIKDMFNINNKVNAPPRTSSKENENLLCNSVVSSFIGDLIKRL